MSVNNLNTIINHELIASLKTKAYLKQNKLLKASDLKLIIPTCYTEENAENFHLHQKKYIVNHAIDKVWKAYNEIPPALAWSGRRIKFSFCFNSINEEISYLNDEYTGLEEGQLIFLEIKVGLGLVKLAVTHQVNNINHAAYSMKFCYVQGGKAAGSQLLQLVKLGDNQTEVVHNTYYKSDSDFRDKKLYPIVHERIINEFHKNVFKYLES